MSEYLNCEQYVLAELEDAKSKIEELESKLDDCKEFSNMLATLLSEYDPDWMENLFGEDKGRLPS